MSRPSAGLLAILSRLTADPQNKVCIISGRTREALQTWFGNMPLVLVAEHGGWLRENLEWSQADLDLGSYKDKILSLLAHYAERTPGALVEEKRFAVVWHYRNVAHGLAYLRNSSLKHELAAMLQDSDIGVYEGNKILEIKPRGLRKDRLAEELLAEYPADFILAAGDDYTDEDMFEVLPDSSWTCKVGTSLAATKARYRIGSVEDAVDLLDTLSRVSA
jgi:trehalose 6-phosphate synthase/phosphatase